MVRIRGQVYGGLQARGTWPLLAGAEPFEAKLRLGASVFDAETDSQSAAGPTAHHQRVGRVP